MNVPPVGARIREERRKRGLSLRALARAVGVSASLISQIETGKSLPSVSTLYAITQALEISVEDVFDAAETAEAAPAAVTVVPAAPAGAVAEALRPPAPGTGPLVRPGEREVLELESGVTWERLGHVPGTDVDFLLVTYAPGGSSSGTGKLMRHGGVEHGYLIEGELTLTLGFDTYSLEPGDAVSFPSVTPHRYRNEGDVPAVGVWFVHETETSWPR
ncbi:helix-turn-helix domain-containing protein [Actinomadura rudentiformis]|uniref:Cupin domain-containing protein n=1 Tax=Actinomadura rudentiformis TaxID=359158 RepID=A0A6H9YEZ0_9ACTN|nr:cupin domain-containing protein [Actinomadura rudentiformis]KAB2340005.1 cupin domain-containing protein [Actinomadura rudentiformis]